MSRVRLLSIGPAKTKPDDHGRTWHPVTLRKKGAEYTVDIEVVVVNGRVSWGADHCSEEIFADLVKALSAEAKVKKLLGIKR